MVKHILFIFTLIFCLQSFSQKLIYSGNGTILNSNSTKLSPVEVEMLLKDNDDLLRSYTAGRSKKTVGNVMLYGGLAMIVGDLGVGVFSDTAYPTFLTIFGTITTLIAIPVKIGFSKKIKNVVNDYNTQNGFTSFEKTNSKLEVVNNNNGLGMRITFN